MYIEASYPRVEGDRAVLRGPWMVHEDWFYCTLHFYYHMMGVSVGTLNIYVETPDDKDLGVSSVCYSVF